MAIIQGFYIFEDGSDLPPDGTTLDCYSFDLTVRHARRTLPQPPRGHYPRVEYTDPAGKQETHNRGWVWVVADNQKDLTGMDFCKAAALVASRASKPISALQFIRELQPTFAQAVISLTGMTAQRDKNNVVVERSFYCFDMEEDLHYEEFSSATGRPRRREIILPNCMIFEHLGSRGSDLMRIKYVEGCPKPEITFPSAANNQRKEPAIVPPKPRKFSQG